MMKGRTLTFNNKRFEMRDGVFHKVKEQPNPSNIVELKDYAEVSQGVHTCAPPLRRSLFLSILIILKWILAFCVYPAYMLATAVKLSFCGMMQMPKLMIKELSSKRS